MSLRLKSHVHNDRVVNNFVNDEQIHHLLSLSKSQAKQLFLKGLAYVNKQEESARERALCQLTECF